MSRTKSAKGHAFELTRISRIPLLPARRRDSHKGDYGRVLILGGSQGMLGAPALAADAALHSGAGLVTLACPRPIQPFVAMMCRCATSLALPATDDGRIDAAATVRTLWTDAFLRTRPPDVAAIGPGLGRGDAKWEQSLLRLIDAFRGDLGAPVVLDADALNAMHPGRNSRSPGWDAQPHPNTVITPHPGELASMQNVTVREIQADRIGWAVRTANSLSARNPADDRAVVLLKGAGTVVTDGRKLYVNKTGNPGMATGGTGDVLTGILAALIGQGLSRFDAAVCAARVHGSAGDIAARRLGETSVTADDVLAALPDAFHLMTK